MEKGGDELVLFDQYPSEIDANIVKGVLETNGVPCVLTNELMSTVLPVMCENARLMIFKRDFELAKRIMKSHPSESSLSYRRAFDDAEEIKKIMNLIDAAKEQMRKEGRTQWQDGRPSIDDIRRDMAQGNAYVLEKGEAIIGYSAIIFTGEPAYDHLQEGNWLTTSFGDECNYVTVHRMVVDVEQWGKGLGSKFLQLIMDYGRDVGCESLRLDTNYDNKSMIALLEKLKFAYCGKIPYPFGERLGFEKMLNNEF